MRTQDQVQYELTTLKREIEVKAQELTALTRELAALPTDRIEGAHGNRTLTLSSAPSISGGRGLKLRIHDTYTPRFIEISLSHVAVVQLRSWLAHYYHAE